MALIKLPVDSLRANYSFKIDLEGTTYTFSFRYNTRDSVWIMDIADEGENIILSGIPLLLGTLLFERFPNSNIPLGDFFVLSLEDSTSEATRDNLGTDVLLMYEESTVEEVA